VLLFLQTPEGRCYGLDEIRAWLRQAGFSRISGPFRSSHRFTYVITLAITRMPEFLVCPSLPWQYPETECGATRALR
jgi:hypothetical protein